MAVGSYKPLSKVSDMVTNFHFFHRKAFGISSLHCCLHQHLLFRPALPQH